jgi:hypothetical protein
MLFQNAYAQYLGTESSCILSQRTRHILNGAHRAVSSQMRANLWRSSRDHTPPCILITASRMHVPPAHWGAYDSHRALLDHLVLAGVRELSTLRRETH